MAKRKYKSKATEPEIGFEIRIENAEVLELYREMERLSLRAADLGRNAAQLEAQFEQAKGLYETAYARSKRARHHMWQKIAEINETYDDRLSWKIEGTKTTDVMLVIKRVPSGNTEQEKRELMEAFAEFMAKGGARGNGEHRTSGGGAGGYL